MCASSSSVVTVSVVLAADLHARPAGQVTRVAAGFADVGVRLAVAEHEVDARSVLSVMALGATAGQTVVVRAEGPRARLAAAAVADVLSGAEAAAS